MFADVAHRIGRRLDEPLPGLAAQLAMAPVYRQDPEMASVDGKRCREAAVLAAVHPNGSGAPSILFIRRPDHVSHHPGQIAFPGGRREDGESLWQTALREAHEEVDLPPDRVVRLGALTPLYVPPSRYCVYPFVGRVDELPGLTPEAGEVADIFSVPLGRLLEPTARKEVTRRVGDREFTVPCFDVDGSEIWGATAMMLAELVAVIRNAVPGA